MGRAGLALRNDEVNRIAANGHFPGRHVLPRRSDGVLDLPPTRLCLSRWRRRVVARGKRDADRDPLVVVEVAQAVRRLKRGLWPATRRSTAGAARCGELEASVDIPSRRRLFDPQGRVRDVPRVEELDLEGLPGVNGVHLCEIEQRRRGPNVDVCAHAALSIDPRAGARGRGELDPEVVRSLLARGPAARYHLKAVLPFPETRCELPPCVVVRTRRAVGRAGTVVPEDVVAVAAVIGSLVDVVHV